MGAFKKLQVQEETLFQESKMESLACDTAGKIVSRKSWELKFLSSGPTKKLGGYSRLPVMAALEARDREDQAQSSCLD